MHRLALPGIVAALVTLAVAADVSAGQVSFHASKGTVRRGGAVTFTGGPCSAHTTVYLLSKLFPGHSYGVGSITATANKKGRFMLAFRIPTTRSNGTYAVTARCGGGNLGVAVTVRVRGGPHGSLTASPAHIDRGGTVTFRGGTCSSGDTVLLISRMFPGRAYGGGGAVQTTASASGTFRTSVVVPHKKPPGLYAVTARCGGGNLGISATVRVG